MNLKKLGSAAVKAASGVGCAMTGFSLTLAPKMGLLLKPLGLATGASGGVLLKQAFEDARDAFRDNGDQEEVHEA